MNKINLILVGFMLLLVGTACEKDRTFVEFEDLEYGAFARELSRTGSFFLTDVENSVIDVSVEFYDVNQGRDVASYSWTVTFQDKDDVGAPDAGPLDLYDFKASEFGTNPDTGLPSVDFSISLQQMFDLFGITLDDVNPGDAFRFDATITMNDGSTFTSANTGNNIVSSAALKGLFSFGADLACPSELGGLIEAQSEAWCGETGPLVTLELIEEANGFYRVANPDDPDNVDAEDFAFGAYTPCYGATATLPGGDLRIKDVCNTISAVGVSRWGEVYTFEDVSVSGSVLTLVWSNDYGEGATSTITRVDGTDWPPLRN